MKASYSYIKKGLWKALTIAGCCTIAFCISCANNNTENSTERKMPATYKKPPSGLTDSLLVKNDAAVFFNADSIQLALMKTQTEKMVFESNVHDCFYQMRNARMVLKQYWPHIRVIETGKARFLEFEKENGIKSLIDIDKKNDQCGIILFNGKKDPQLVDMMNIDTELDYYFKH